MATQDTSPSNDYGIDWSQMSEYSPDSIGHHLYSLAAKTKEMMTLPEVSIRQLLELMLEHQSLMIDVVDVVQDETMRLSREKMDR